MAAAGRFLQWALADEAFQLWYPEWDSSANAELNFGA